MIARLAAIVCVIAGCGDDRGVTPDAAPPADAALACLGGQPVGDVLGGAWDERFTVAGVTGSVAYPPVVHDFARDVDGSLVAAGRFRWFAGQAVAPLLRWRDGAWEPARTTWELEPYPDGFDAIAISPDGDLALAAPTGPDGATEIWLDDGTGLRGIGWVNGRVRALAWFDGLLWVGGWIDMADVGAWLLAWDGTAWSPPPGGPPDWLVYELTVAGDELLVGGAFSAIGGISADRVAGYDGSTWTGYDLPDAFAAFALGRDAGGELYAGGALTDGFSGPLVGGLARWTGRAWELVGGGLGRSSFQAGVVADLALHDGVLDVIGCFTTAGGELDDPLAIRALDVARWDGTAWHALEPGLEPVLVPWPVPGVCGDDHVFAINDAVHQRLAFDGGRLLVGGSFGGHGGVLSPGMIAHDGAGWVAQGAGGLGIGGSIDRVAASPDRCEAYALGELTHAGGAAAIGKLLRWSDDHWEGVAAPLPPNTFCGGMALSRTGTLVLGCTEADPLQLHRLWRLDGDTLVRLGFDLPGQVNQLWFDPAGSLWIAGGGFDSGYLARLDGNFLTIVEDRFDGAVLRVDARSPGDIVIGGAFTRIGGRNARHIARFDGVEWLPLGVGLPGPVAAIGRDDDRIYASTIDQGLGRLVLGAFDGQWTELATAESGMTASSFVAIEQIVPLDGGLLLGGTLALDDGSGSAPLLYRGGRFHSLGGGSHTAFTNNNTVAVSADALLVSGWVNEVGTETTRRPSIGVARWLRR